MTNSKDVKYINNRISAKCYICNSNKSKFIKIFPNK